MTKLPETPPIDSSMIKFSLQAIEQEGLDESSFQAKLIIENIRRNDGIVDFKQFNAVGPDVIKQVIQNLSALLLDYPNEEQLPTPKPCNTGLVRTSALPKMKRGVEQWEQQSAPKLASGAAVKRQSPMVANATSKASQKKPPIKATPATQPGIDRTIAHWRDQQQRPDLQYSDRALRTGLMVAVIMALIAALGLRYFRDDIVIFLKGF